jgi:polygalacturonase
MPFSTHIMSIRIVVLFLGAGVFAASSHTPTVAMLQDRAPSCTFTDAATAMESKAACSTIVLSNITVPAGTTLDMTQLNDGTTVRYNSLMVGVFADS